MASDHHDEDEDYFVPLVDQRVFGAGIKRKRVAFVHASENEDLVSLPAQPSNAGSRYLEIVRAQQNGKASAEEGEPLTGENGTARVSSTACPICGQEVSMSTGDGDTHETSIVHQVGLKHSHPPSHLDRSHVGLRYLEDHGWDPDARHGLGARREGIRIPIKAKEKNDTTGLGLLTVDEDEADRTKGRKRKQQEEKQIVKLNAKEVRRLESEQSRRADKLRQSLYGEDLSQYLGPNG